MSPLVNVANLQTFQAVNLLKDPGYDPSDHRIPNCARISLVWSLDGGRFARNELHGSYSGTFNGSQAQCNAILSALTTGTNWTSLAAFLAPTCQLGNVVIRDLNQENQPPIASNGPAAPGTSSGSAMPVEVAAVATLRTAFTGPAHRGRIYVPGWATNALGTGNVIAAGAVTALQNWSSIIAGAFSAQGYVFCIGHPHRLAYTGAGGRQHPARDAGTVPITSVAVRDNHWDTQRRRGLK